MNQSRVILESTIRGKPKNPDIKINPKIASKTIPQAWKFKGNWYYNFPGAVAEGGRLLPTEEQWLQYIKENPNSGNELPKNGFYCRRDGHLLIVLKEGHGYYWSSSMCGPLAILFYSCHISEETPGRTHSTDNLEQGFSLRCLKE